MEDYKFNWLVENIHEDLKHHLVAIDVACITDEQIKDLKVKLGLQIDELIKEIRR